MNRVLRFLFFTFFVRPAVLVILGLNVRHRERLPTGGPAILVANHNSHLDTMVLMTLLPTRLLPHIRAVAAQDYFFRFRLLKWFALRIVGIIPIDRKIRKSAGRPLAPISEALEQKDVVIMFPEGSRGDPEKMGEFKTGVAHVARLHPEVPIFPIYMHGLGKALPRGEGLLIPFFCDIFVGEPIHWTGDKAGFVQELNRRVQALMSEGCFTDWH